MHTNTQYNTIHIEQCILKFLYKLYIIIQSVYNCNNNESSIGAINTAYMYFKPPSKQYPQTSSILVSPVKETCITFIKQLETVLYQNNATKITDYWSQAEECT